MKRNDSNNLMTLGMAQEPYFVDVKVLSERLSLSPRTLRSYIADSLHPLPAYKLNGELLFRWSEVVSWIEAFRVKPVDIDQLVDSFLKKE
jgi:hypothetical protein